MNRLQARKHLVFVILMTLLFSIIPISVQAKSSSFKIVNGVLVSYTGKSATVTIPPTVTTIGSSAFSNNKYIQTVTIPKTVKNIEYSAFNSCKNLRKVTMHSGVTTIGFSAFNDCTRLSSITIPKTVTSVGSNAFNNTYWLNHHKSTFVTVGNGILIKYKGKATSITIPTNVIHIAEEAFINSKVTNVKCSNTIKTIGINAFAGSTKLTSITLSSKLTNIAYNAFAECTNLKSITIPDSVKTIASNAFYQCKNLSKVKFSDSSKLTTIESEAFSGCTSLTSIKLPEGLSELGASAFENSGISSAYLPKSITYLNRRVFNSCKNLRSVTLPSNLKTIDDEAFFGCSALTEITLPTSLREVGMDAFTDSGLVKNQTGDFIIVGDTLLLKYQGAASSVTIPDNITVIGGWAFISNTNLQELTLGRNTISLSDRAFFHCENLEKITFNNSLESIGASTFSNCSALTSISLPDSLKELSHYTFLDCTSLSTIEFPKGKLSYGIDSFHNTKWYNDYNGDFVIANDGTLLGYKGKDTSIVLPNTVKSLAPSALEYTQIKQATIPGTIKTIPYSLFYFSTVENVTFEYGVTEIGSGCFEECYSLKTVRIPETVTKIGDNIFFREEAGSTIVVIICKKGSYADKYAKANNLNVKYE